MNKHIQIISTSILMLTLTVSSFANTPIDVDQSRVEWLGKKVTGQHNGNLQLKEASIDIQNQALVGGRFVFDMTSIKVLDIKDQKWNSKLETHLKNDDFFAVDKFPMAIFEIISSTPLRNTEPGEDNYEIKGDLTIKGITHVVSFKARVDIQQDHSSASGMIIVDRTLYGIRYKSGRFFENLEDKAIYDDFSITFEVQTK